MYALIQYPPALEVLQASGLIIRSAHEDNITFYLHVSHV